MNKKHHFVLGTQLLVEAETGNSYVVMANDTGDGHEHDDEDDDHMHFDPSAHSTLRDDPVCSPLKLTLYEAIMKPPD